MNRNHFIISFQSSPSSFANYYDARISISSTHLEPIFIYTHISMLVFDFGHDVHWKLYLMERFCYINRRVLWTRPNMFILHVVSKIHVLLQFCHSQSSLPSLYYQPPYNPTSSTSRLLWIEILHLWPRWR